MSDTHQHGDNVPNPDQIDAQVEKEMAEALGDGSLEQLMEAAAAADAVPSADPPADLQPAPTADRRPDRGSGREAAPARQQVARGRIADIRGEDVFVKLAGIEGKHEGVVPAKQFDRPPRIGSIMDFVIQRFDEAEGLLILSREGAVGNETWDNIHKGSVVEARVTGTNKGGLELELIGRIRGFMPMSQIDLHHVDDPETFVGQKIAATVQQIDRRARNVVLSRRAHLETERRANSAKLWNEIEVGQSREGVVSSVTNYGAFIDLGGLDGLLHVSDMRHSRVDTPADVVQVGQAVTVKVLKVDREQERISLGLKQLEGNPWEGIGDRVKQGDYLTGRVMRLAEFGAFVEVEPGVEGLIPISEMSWKRIHRPAEVVNDGDTIRVVVLQVDTERQRIALSLKQAEGDPWVGAAHKYAKSGLIEATVLRVTDFGAFVEIDRGVEGLVHISELADRHVARVEDVLSVGQREQFRVLEVDEDNRRISLSLKAVAAPAPQSASPATPTKSAKAHKKPTGPLKGGMGSAGGLGIGLGDLKL